MTYRVQYLCSFRPVWNDAENFEETADLAAAVDYARRLCQARGGRPVQVVNQAESVIFSFTWPGPPL